ncbi:MAG: SH3 domain-containing protein [Deltaproteobacteria bacterium]|nr:MAG: SH3 domain-containing protein [Deltaproteobacteria bacterium]
MISSLIRVNSRQHLGLLLAVSFCFIPACTHWPSKQSDDVKKLQQTLAKREASLETLEDNVETLEDNIAKFQLRLLERDAQIKQLEERLDSQQEMLDEAIQEVVRAKAKLRSLESKAEAASEMAEAEIAVNALKAQLAGQTPNPDLTKAQELLKMSAQEFKKQNYGGAVYLTSQAKGHIRAGQIQLTGREKVAPIKRLPPITGEVFFALPLPLQVLRMSNLRMQPDLESKVITTLEKGTPLIGYSYKDKWVRVVSENGAYGWVFHTLVGGR